MQHISAGLKITSPTHFAIFIPGSDDAETKTLADVGLADLEHRSQTSNLAAEDSPTKAAGTLYTWGVWPHGQESNCSWEPSTPNYMCDEPGAYQVGYFPGKGLPVPELLKRSVQLRGREIVLGDGRPWLISCWRKLPVDVVFAGGEPVYEDNPRYAPLVMSAKGWLERFERDEPLGGDGLGELFDTILLLLKTNYRVTPEIVGQVLRLLNNQNLGDVMTCFLDVPIDITIELAPLFDLDEYFSQKKRSLYIKDAPDVPAGKLVKVTTEIVDASDAEFRTTTTDGSDAEESRPAGTTHEEHRAGSREHCKVAG